MRSLTLGGVDDVRKSTVGTEREKSPASTDALAELQEVLAQRARLVDLKVGLEPEECEGEPRQSVLGRRDRRGHLRFSC